MKKSHIELQPTLIPQMRLRELCGHVNFGFEIMKQFCPTSQWAREALSRKFDLTHLWYRIAEHHKRAECARLELMPLPRPLKLPAWHSMAFQVPYIAAELRIPLERVPILCGWKIDGSSIFQEVQYAFLKDLWRDVAGQYIESFPRRE